MSNLFTKQPLKDSCNNYQGPRRSFNGFSQNKTGFKAPQEFYPHTQQTGDDLTSNNENRDSIMEFWGHATKTKEQSPVNECKQQAGNIHRMNQESQRNFRNDSQGQNKEYVNWKPNSCSGNERNKVEDMTNPLETMDIEDDDEVYTKGPYNPYKDPSSRWYTGDDLQLEKPRRIRPSKLHESGCACGNQNCKLHLNQSPTNIHRDSPRTGPGSQEIVTENRNFEVVKTTTQASFYRQERFGDQQKFEYRNQQQYQERPQFPCKRHSTGEYRNEVKHFWDNKENQHQQAQSSSYVPNKWNQRPQDGQQQFRNGYQGQQRTQYSHGNQQNYENNQNNQVYQKNGRQQWDGAPMKQSSGNFLHQRQFFNSNVTGAQTRLNPTQWNQVNQLNEVHSHMADKTGPMNTSDQGNENSINIEQKEVQFFFANTSANEKTHKKDEKSQTSE